MLWAVKEKAKPGGRLTARQRKNVRLSRKRSHRRVDQSFPSNPVTGMRTFVTNANTATFGRQ